MRSRGWTSVRSALIALSVACLAAPVQAQTAAPHTFVLTYSGFGPVQSTGAFQPGDGYDLRAEGCYAKHSVEAICGFTLRATRPLVVTNVANATHATNTRGEPMRTCCMFVQGDDAGYMITTAGETPAGVATLHHALDAGQEVGLMLRIPNYRQRGPVASVTFSRGQGDPGVTTRERIVELR